MTDHNAYAKQLLARNQYQNNSALEIAMGQAHATLYLAEQQRIANLIAYWQLHTPRSVEESFAEPGQIEVKQIHDDGDIGIDDQVRKALGLA